MEEVKRVEELDGAASALSDVLGFTGGDEADDECDVPPIGWRCTRGKGHIGPCAAVECPEDIELVARGMKRLRTTRAELTKKHGTPPEFAAAVYRTVPEFLSMAEARDAVDRYAKEWFECGDVAPNAQLERGFDDHWALVRHGNPALADDVFAESLARTAWDAATIAERTAAELRCAKTPVLLTGHHAYTALSVQTMMMNAVSMRSNAI